MAGMSATFHRNTVAVMGGKYLIGISAAIRKVTGLNGGHPIRVELTAPHRQCNRAVPRRQAAVSDSGMRGLD
jgi:hypothetical protein